MKPTLPTDPASRNRILKMILAAQKLSPADRHATFNRILESKGLDKAMTQYNPEKRKP